MGDSILTNSRARSRFSHTDRPNSVNKMFIIWPNKTSTDCFRYIKIHLGSKRPRGHKERELNEVFIHSFVCVL